MKKFAVLFVVLAFAATTYGAPFNDVPRTHWAYDAIQKAVNAGILQGYDGKFHGKRLLNRYQMAVITAKILGQVGSVSNRGGGGGDVKKMIANLEALTIEFADELALLNVKVSTLEDTVTELRQGGGGYAAPPMSSGGGGELGFTAFAAFALLVEDENAGATRYSGTDSAYFTLPQVSLGVDKEVNPGVYFHAQFDFVSDVGNKAFSGVGNVGINQAYFFVDELFGDIGGKVGAFAPPFSMEHNGPFRTLNLTITPSIANTWHDVFRYYGLEIQKTKDVQPDDMIWKFGIVSNTDAVGLPGFQLNDAPVGINGLGVGGGTGETDDGFGFYIWLGKKPERSGDWGWNLSFMDNGGDNSATAPAVASAETSFFQFGFEWANDDILVMLQYVSGSMDVGAETDFTTFYLLLNYKIDEKASVTLRYDDLEWDLGGTPSVTADANAITFAYNRQVTDNSILQFEYVSPDGEDFAGGTDADDDLIQFRYKVHF